MLILNANFKTLLFNKNAKRSIHPIKLEGEETLSDKPQTPTTEISDETARTGTRRAIILIPGFPREERFLRRDVLVRNLLTIERSPLREVGNIEAGGEQGKRLAARPVRGSAAGGQGTSSSNTVAEVDVFEAYWGDLIPESTSRTPLQHLLWGLEIIVYWVFNWRSWTALRVSPYMTFGLLSSGSLLVLWYISIVLLAADAIGQDSAGVSSLGLPHVLQELVKSIVDVAAVVGNWQLWLAIAAILPFLKIDELVMIASFVKDYFQNKPDETEVGLRHRLRTRIQTTLDNVYKADYDEVTLLAHSFGTVFAIDLMADWPHRRDLARTSLVTMGAPIAVLACRSPWLASEVKRFAARNDIVAWDDYHAATDWLCTAIPARKDFAGAGASHKLVFETKILEKLSGRSHMSYYRDDHLLEHLVQAKA